ncbi:glycine cleavage system protein T [Pseudoclavibacter endophyticus]|uniref:Aminomethyl transferase family protein n=1 Tax=Pseudoclavibacter endophyticus TaxID=1778590 RepID=A0A6H9WQX2_9MICO|nr:aminomethyltransferase family protein [Pseudoclavibacter endophyticus]KAB1649185.1 aminomethyl transferase family protein [Pseudoclavibacter endophyticus]GGA64759.1 glycine cleavage system protein T [Pseudoclavibacter endophyticus]
MTHTTPSTPADLGAAAGSVADVIAAAGNPVTALRGAPFPAMSFLQWEQTNWQHEQYLWRETAAFLDQSHHMVDLFVEGPDALRLFSELGVNSFANFGPGKAKQFVAAAPDGHLIGDAILFHLENGTFDLVGLPTCLAWVLYNIETGDYDVTHTWDDNSWVRRGSPRLYRYEVQGPAADDIVRCAIDGELPALRFFQMGSVSIAGRRVGTLKHGMAGAAGFEFWGPWADAEAVRDALTEAGEPFGMGRVGYRAYTTLTLESAWISLPVPAVYDLPALQGYREWLPAGHLGSLAGSFESDSISDYYVTPYDIGYGKVVRFDHDFVGRDALERIAERPGLRKVTFAWNGDDVADIYRSQFTDDGRLPARFVDVPKSRAARFTYDTVTGPDGAPAGFSLDTGFLGPDRRVLSIGMVDEAHAGTGTQVTITWGEPEGSTRPHLPAHRQTTVRATVLPAPYSDYARTQYRAV